MKSLCAVVLFSVGCNKAPPASQLPDGQAAIDRMRASYSCVAGIQVNEAKADGFAEQRLRTDIMMMAAMPAKFRLDVNAPVVGNVAVLTSDGTEFALSDLRNNQFVTGPARACNVTRFTRAPIPVNALVDLVTGRAPILVHDTAPRVQWDGGGYYVLNVVGKNNTSQEIRLAPRPADFGLPWQQQRFRVLRIKVIQENVVLYQADLDDHQVAQMGTSPALSPDDMMLGLTPVQPIGPVCSDAEIPMSIHVEVPTAGSDLILRFAKVIVNPAIESSAFRQQTRPGLIQVVSTCDD